MGMPKMQVHFDFKQHGTSARREPTAHPGATASFAPREMGSHSEFFSNSSSSARASLKVRRRSYKVEGFGSSGFAEAAAQTARHSSCRQSSPSIPPQSGDVTT